MDQISEHQRDLTNSASSRFLTELVTAFAYSVERLTAALNDLDVNEPMLRRNVRAAVGETLAEPLYILLSSRGHPDGHGCARRLAARARREGRALPELIREDPELAPYLSGLSERQQRVLEDPESYVGLAVDRTAATCDQWELRCDTVRRQLEAEQRDAAQAAGPKRLV
jgi:adenylosuccinate lyase